MNTFKNDIYTVRLRLELKNSFLTDYERKMLKRYGESATGDSIIRDILIPSDMPLHNLHYTIQKLYGWQNSHLRSFHLPEELYNKLTKRTVKGWADLVGILFQPPSELEGELFWDDDYQSGSINAWLKKKYTGPYIYGGTIEYLENARQDVQELLHRFNKIEVRESFNDFMKRAEKDEHAELKIIKEASLIDLTLEEMEESLYIEGGTDNLLETLEVDKILAYQEVLATVDFFPVTKELIYNYDFGDDWIVNITKHKNCDDLIKQNLIDNQELKDAKQLVLDKHQPVCIHAEGLSVLDDVGGLSGFANFLGEIYEGTNKSESSEARSWARSLGWSARKVSVKSRL